MRPLCPKQRCRAWFGDVNCGPIDLHSSTVLTRWFLSFSGLGLQHLTLCSRCSSRFRSTSRWLRTWALLFASLVQFGQYFGVSARLRWTLSSYRLTIFFRQVSDKIWACLRRSSRRQCVVAGSRILSTACGFGLMLFLLAGRAVLRRFSRIRSAAGGYRHKLFLLACLLYDLGSTSVLLPDFGRQQAVSDSRSPTGFGHAFGVLLVFDRHQIAAGSRSSFGSSWAR